MNQSIVPTLAALALGILPGIGRAESYSVEVWLLDVPSGGVASPLPDTGRLQLSPVTAEDWLTAFGGKGAVATHLVLDLAHAEDFSIELPGLGCAFHGQGALLEETSGVRFDLVSLDTPERAKPDCALTGPAIDPATLPGKGSARETRLRVENGQTLVFTPVRRADGRERILVWRTLVK